jgi:hypothetical protein
MAAARIRSADLRVLPGLADAAAEHGWRDVADQLWRSWRSLPDLEERIERSFGPHLGDELLVLWAIARFGCGTPADENAIQALVDDDLRPRFGGAAAADMVALAFALGAGWAGLRPARPAPAGLSSRRDA